MSNTSEAEINVGSRFAFGQNWLRFLTNLDESSIQDAVADMSEKLDCTSMAGQRFLDIGSGSGLSSLAAYRMGAEVTSFDYDQDSVACTKLLRDQYAEPARSWEVVSGSVLDRGFVESLGTYDIVYSWGVLHHTGDMATALKHAALPVGPSGSLFIAIYNDQGWTSRYWTTVKFLWNKYKLTRLIILPVHTVHPFCTRIVVRALTGRLQLRRGMSHWTDLIDWLGGYPFEVATPKKVFETYKALGFDLRFLETNAGRPGCNEYIFQRRSDVE